MKILTTLSTILFLSGCSMISNLMPSKWDQNQARVITDIRQEVGAFDCKGNVVAQLQEIDGHIIWFKLYSDYRKADDINKMMTPLQTTINELETRIAAGPISPIYCQLKKAIITEQTDLIGHTIEGSLP